MKPLAERLRPKNFEEFINQEHLLGKQAVLRKMIEKDKLSSMILWGPPGVGKTTLAYLIANHTKRPFFKINAVGTSVKQLREIFQKAEKSTFFSQKTPILFIDEIHRFNKAQQDDLLENVEKGKIILIGSTTENPSFEIISPLLSRCQIFVLKPLEKEHLEKLLERAIREDEILKKREIQLQQTNKLIAYSSGDARRLLNLLEVIVNTVDDPVVINDDLVENIAKTTNLFYDKKGDYHYDLISAYIKSIRGSDPDAALYYLARMLEAGEDIKFIARRLIISAAEDIGLANPNALLLATETFRAVEVVGMPEAKIILAETTIYLATSPKSNSAYLAINKAIEKVRETGNIPVPLHLRNAPTSLMKQLGYSQGYKYPHNFEGNFVFQKYLPEQLGEISFYSPQNNSVEQKIKQRLNKWWKKD